ncbi:hypothetical protein DYB32_004974 [Aphanomyces invadans]|uniref:5'-nucleotidase n=1 Tax=Aphanomyces invadans TaxID=157072 RepID=A0A3R6YYY0_9STRA|nr:hypothetical protein DYB32_004974 [Aphanomyces invadans]
MAADGPSQLLVIADFDYTLTPYYTPKGEHAHSCHGIISGSGFLGPEFQAKANALFQQFYPIEISPLLTHDEKEPHMIEWFVIHPFLLVVHFKTHFAQVGALIHCHNKNTAVVRDTPFWDECHSRRNVVLLGDSIGDVNMTEGLDGKEVLRIGFLNTHIEERMAEYLSLYDVVIVNDGTLHFAHVVVDLITRPPSPPRSVAEVPLAGL